MDALEIYNKINGLLNEMKFNIEKLSLGVKTFLITPF